MRNFAYGSPEHAQFIIKFAERRALVRKKFVKLTANEVQDLGKVGYGLGRVTTETIVEAGIDRQTTPAINDVDRIIWQIYPDVKPDLPGENAFGVESGHKLAQLLWLNTIREIRRAAVGPVLRPNNATVGPYASDDSVERLAARGGVTHGVADGNDRGDL